MFQQTTTSYLSFSLTRVLLSLLLLAHLQNNQVTDINILHLPSV